MNEYRRFFRTNGGSEFFVAYALGWSILGLVGSAISFLVLLIGGWLQIKLGTNQAHALEFKVDGVTLAVPWFSVADHLITLGLIWLLLLAFVIRPANRRQPHMKQCPECLGDMPAAARRCWHCGQPVMESPTQEAV